MIFNDFFFVKKSFWSPETAIVGVLWKKVFLKISQTPVLESLLNKVAAFMPTTLLKRVSNKGVSLWILRNF